MNPNGYTLCITAISDAFLAAEALMNSLGMSRHRALATTAVNHTPTWITIPVDTYPKAYGALMQLRAVGVDCRLQGR